MKVARHPRTAPATREAAFTIVETLFVLAIAGLILLIVFEALPALQRSSRNNQRKQDVQTILEAVSHYELNNSGTFPAKCGDTSMNLCDANSTDPLYYVASKLTLYDPHVAGNVVITPQSRTDPATLAKDVPALTGVTAPDTVFVYNYERCDTSTQGAATIQGAGYSDTVALYALDSGGSNISAECQQL